jgi:hypothetical protein
VPAVLGWFAPKPVLLPGPNKHRPWQRESNSKGLICELKHILGYSLQVWSKNVKKRSEKIVKNEGSTRQSSWFYIHRKCEASFQKPTPA